MSLHSPEDIPVADQPTDDPAPVPPGQAPPQAPPPAPSTTPRSQVHGTRTGRVWVAVCAGALIAIALIIFMVQNTHTVQVSFLGVTGRTSLGLMLLIAAVGGIVLTLVVGSARILQLRRAVRRRRG